MRLLTLGLVFVTCLVLVNSLGIDRRKKPKGRLKGKGKGKKPAGKGKGASSSNSEIERQWKEVWSFLETYKSQSEGSWNLLEDILRDLQEDQACQLSSSQDSSALRAFFSTIKETYGYLFDYKMFPNATEKMRTIEADLVSHTISKHKPPEGPHNLPNGTTFIEELISILLSVFHTCEHEDAIDENYKEIIKKATSQSECDMANQLAQAVMTMNEVLRGEVNLNKLWRAVINNTDIDPRIFPFCSKDYDSILFNETILGFFKGYKNPKSIGMINGMIGGTADGLLLIGRQLNNCKTLCEHCLIPSNNDTRSTREGPFCFAGSGKVETLSGIKNISELFLGDYVRTFSGDGNTHFTEFIGWLLRSQSSPVEMLQIFTSQRSSSLTLTSNHIVFTTNTTKYADELQLGDSLVYWNGSHTVDEKVREILRTDEIGSWSPLTRDGTLFVDGYLASCYASFPHQLSDLAMTPVKYLPTNLLDDDESQHMDGVRPIVKLLKKFGELTGARERNVKTNEHPFRQLHEAPKINNFFGKSEF